MFANHLVVDERLINRREVFPLEVLDDRDLQGGLIIDVLDESGYRVKPGCVCRPPPSLAGDELVAAVG